MIMEELPKNKEKFTEEIYRNDVETHITNHGLEYCLEKDLNKEVFQDYDVLLNLDMGIEGRQILMYAIVFVLYIYLACTN